MYGKKLESTAMASLLASSLMAIFLIVFGAQIFELWVGAGDSSVFPAPLLGFGVW